MLSAEFGRRRLNRRDRQMSVELKYLALTALLTAALWIPYIVCQVLTNGFLSGESHVDPRCDPCRFGGSAQPGRNSMRSRPSRPSPPWC